MTWQERLRQLDARLAGGELSANDYRRARDEILAEASSGSAPEARGDLWTPAAEKPAEQTAVVVEPDNSAETTQVVETLKADEEQTQVVPANTFVTLMPPVEQGAPPPPGMPPQGMLPPGPPRPAPPLHGQEVFADASRPRSGGTLVRFLVPLLVLVLVGAGVWWFAFRDDSGDTPASPPPTSTAQEKKAPSVDQVAGMLPELPGTASDNDGAMPVDRAQELKLFTPA